MNENKNKNENNDVNDNRGVYNAFNSVYNTAAYMGTERSALYNTDVLSAAALVTVNWILILAVSKNRKKSESGTGFEFLEGGI